MAKADVFARRMKTLAKDIETRHYERVNKLALAIQKELITTTPVDEGTAISNWTLTLGSPETHPYNAYAPGNHGSTRQLNIGAAYSQAMTAVSDRRIGQDIWISNSLYYITLLNDGSSTQAPSGFVQAAVMRGIKSIRGIKVIV